MTGGNRGQALLRAQRPGPGPRLGAAPDYIRPRQDYVQAWDDILAVTPDVLRWCDEPAVAGLAVSIAGWRAGRRDESVRELYRYLGRLFVPMRERRRLLFPERPPRR